MFPFSLKPYDPEKASVLRPLIARHERVGFSSSAQRAAKWYGGFAPEMTYFLHTPSDEIVASVGLLQDNQGGGLWCCGKQLDGLSYTSLVVEPAARGRGVATALNQAIIREADKRKLTVATLYPANLELYRKSGFELVADYEILSIAPSAIRPAAKPESVIARSGNAENRDEMILLRNRLLAERRATGAYQRDYLSWQMLFETTSENPAEVVVFFRNNEMVGYLILDMLVGGERPTDRAIWVQDWMAADFETRCALVQVLASFGTVHKHIRWQPSASEDIAEAMVPQPTYITPVLREPLAARVIDPVKALSGRGYYSTETATLRLTIDDELLNRKYDLALTLIDGTPTVGPVKKPGLPKLNMSMNALAPLIFGYRSASSLSRVGWIDGSKDALVLAESLFKCERSICGDFY